MDFSITIKNFLNRVRRRRKGIHFVQGALRLLALGLAGALFGNLFAYFSDNPRPFLGPFLIVWGAVLAGWLVFLLAKGFFTKTPLPQTALWVESQVEGLNNALINSVQLEPHLDGPPQSKSGLSQDMIRELIKRTGQRIQTLKVSEIVPRTPLVRSGQWTACVFLIALAVALLLPDFMSRGYSHWAQPPALARVALESESIVPAPAPPEKKIQYSMDHLSLTFNYPAYTRLESATEDPSGGTIQALPGTEVILKGNVNVPVEGASLVLNGRDALSMSVAGETSVTGRFILKEPGFYQFRFKSPQGEKLCWRKSTR